MANTSLLRRLGLRESTSIVIGTVIGTGVFLKAAVMSQNAGSPVLVMVAWLLAGVLSLAGALSYAEIGVLFPKAGGEYVYLREAYGPLFGFLFGWMRFWIGSPGSIAAIAVGGATFLSQLLPVGGAHLIPTVAIALIACFTALNCFSVAFGGRIQTFMTGLKLVMIVGLAIAIFFGATLGSWSHLTDPKEAPGWMGFSHFGAAVLAALWAFDGWNNLPMAAGEIKDPSKVIPRALGFGMLAVFLIYAAINLAYFYAVPFPQVVQAHSTLFPGALPIATLAARTVFGGFAVLILAAMMFCSAIGSMNGSILTGARVPYAMAEDGLFFPQLAKLNSASHVPVTALLVQGTWASVLAASGTFDQLTDYVIFAGWIFYALVTASLFVFRRRLPNAERSYKAPFYPYLPIIFLICSCLLLVNTMLTSTRESVIGLVFIALGVPAYYAFRKSQNVLMLDRKVK
jgi:APA family basic amino acid/polyamine antiporter